MKKIISVIGMIMALNLNAAEVLTNAVTGEVWITDDGGAYTTDNSRIFKSGDTYLGDDGRLYKREGSHLIQIGGIQQPQVIQPQPIEIRIIENPIVSLPILVPSQHFRTVRPFRPKRLRDVNKPPFVSRKK